MKIVVFITSLLLSFYQLGNNIIILTPLRRKLSWAWLSFTAEMSYVGDNPRRFKLREKCEYMQ